MNSKNIYLIILLFIGQFIFSQNEKLIHGRIIVKDGSPQGVHIINMVNEKETLSDAKGNSTSKRRQMIYWFSRQSIWIINAK